VGVNTLRAINTAEYGYKFKHGTFASWDVLLISDVFSGQNHFALQTFGAPYEPQLGNVHFSKAPEILPGWTIRLNVTSDGKGYDVLLEDKTDKHCGYAVVSNESGLIRQSKARVVAGAALNSRFTRNVPLARPSLIATEL
jgi:hypothetical protein